MMSVPPGPGSSEDQKCSTSASNKRRSSDSTIHGPDNVLSNATMNSAREDPQPASARADESPPPPPEHRHTMHSASGITRSGRSQPLCVHCPRRTDGRGREPASRRRLFLSLNPSLTLSFSSPLLLLSYLLPAPARAGELSQRIFLCCGRSADRWWGGELYRARAHVIIAETDPGASF